MDQGTRYGKAAAPKVGRRLAAAALAGLLALGAVGCNAPAASGAADGQGSSQAAEQAAAMDFEYTDRDLDASYDEASATVLDLAAGAVSGSGASYDAAEGLFTVQQEGTYLLRGEGDGVQVKVSLGDQEKAQLVLDGAMLSADDRPALYVEEADKVFVTLAEGSQNSIAGGQADNEAGDALNGAVYSKADITFNGGGALAVWAEAADCHGIASKDDLVITGGTYEVSATKNGLHGKDCVKIRDGVFTIQAGNDAVKSSNQEEADRGFIAIDGGTLVVTGCEEGYEAREIYLNGGNSTITASDDAVNASASENTSGRECLIQVNGGELTVYAGGDGIDSNGSLEVNGGTVLVSGPASAADGALDYEGQATVNGGTVLAVGPAGMACGFTGGIQGSALVDFQGAAGQPVTLSAADGTVLAEFTPANAYQTAVVSSPELAVGASFTLASGSSSVQGTVAETSPGMGGGPGGMGGMNGVPGREGGAPSDGSTPPQGFDGGRGKDGRSEGAPQPPDGAGEGAPELPEGFDGAEPPQPPSGDSDSSAPQPPDWDGGNRGSTQAALSGESLQA